jgi:GTP-binding protein HflX
LKNSFSIEKIRKDRVILAALILAGADRASVMESLDELDALCRSAGGEVVGKITQSAARIHPGHLFGTGKIQEIKELCRSTKASLIIYDGDLTPSQQQKLEEIIDIAVIDRPALILDIFARHARSREAITQVQLAQLEYLLPRLTGNWSHLERQEAAIGTRGPGETQLESDRRLVRKKILELKKMLKRIDRERDIQRKRRSRKINFCLVGYTNAGKTRLFNRLTGEKSYVADKLFATLDSTTRKLPIGGKEDILLTDTVGFIRKLPVDLVASFRSTLKEANTADTLLHVVDFSAHDIDEKISTVNRILKEIGCGEIKRLLIFNKTDLVDNPELRRNMLARYKECLFVSAKTGEGIDLLFEKLGEIAAGLFSVQKARISRLDQRAIALLAGAMQISAGNVEGDDIVFIGRLAKYDLMRLEKAGIRFENAE